MEAFQLLSRGGVKYDKQRFKSDMRLFNKSPTILEKGKQKAQPVGELPSELDFFKYAEGGSGKRPSVKVDGERKPKRQRTSDDGSESHDDDQVNTVESGDEEEDHMPRQRVTAKGRDVPEPADSFDMMAQRFNLLSRLQRNLLDSGFKRPTGIQSHGVPILLEGRDMAAISPTGTGKTLAYLLPIFASLGAPVTTGGHGARALVVVPTRELAHQIHNECLKLAQGRKWRIILFSKATASTLKEKNVRDNVDIIISTPMRLVAALQAGDLDLDNVRHLVLDEADRMLDSEFLTQVQEVVAACTHKDLQKAVLSATLPANAEKIAMGMLNDPIRVVVGLKDTPLPNIHQSLTYVADDASKLPSLLTHFAQPYNPPVLVFTSTQPRAASLSSELVLAGVNNVDCLHAGMTVHERELAMARMRRGESWVMVCTEVAARGLDFAGVREVVNFDFPRSVQSYVHRIGRTGRAGREGKAVTYFTDEDAPYLKAIANVLLQSGSTVPEWILKLPKPSKLKRRQMGKVKRADIVNSARKIGRGDAIKKRDMIAGSKRRKERESRTKDSEEDEDVSSEENQ